jgi:glutaredoxin-dependent peroxiredoxin
LVEIGQTAPDVELVDTERKATKISDFKGKTTVLLFYPGAFTGTCTKEMCTFRDSLSRFNNMDANVVGISVDGPFANKAFKSANNVNFPLLSDYSRAAVEAYNDVLNDFAGLKGYAAAKRAVFILDKDQKVRFKWISDNPGIEPDYAVVEKEAQKLKG